MGGLLWTSERGRVGHELARWQAELRRDDLVVRAGASRLWAALEEVVRRLEAIDVEVVTLKGITTEARWYGRQGERPCDDVDVLVRPADLGRVDEITHALHPDHPLCGSLEALVRRGSVPAITLAVQGVPVDLHFDLLQLGIPLREPTPTLARTLPFPLAGGAVVRVLDPETALVHLLVNLNKDRFGRLLAYADIARLLQHEELDWDFVDEMVRAEGLETAVYLTLGAVCGTLNLALPEPATITRRGVRPRLWRLLWRPTVRLQGTRCAHAGPGATSAPRSAPDAAATIRRRPLPPQAAPALRHRPRPRAGGASALVAAGLPGAGVGALRVPGRGRPVAVAPHRRAGSSCLAAAGATAA